MLTILFFTRFVVLYVKKKRIGSGLTVNPISANEETQSNRRLPNPVYQN